MHAATGHHQTLEGLAGCPPCHGSAAAPVHAIIARGVLHYIGDLDAALARLAAVLQPGGILAIRDGVPIDQARCETMNDQLASAGAPTEPRNGLDPDLLSQTLSALGLCTRRPVVVGTGTFATPPWVPELYEGLQEPCAPTLPGAWSLCS
jgi:hypothetical protein